MQKQQFEELRPATLPTEQSVQGQADARQQVDDLLAVLAAERRKRKIRQRWIGGGVTAFMVIMLLVAILTRDFHSIGSMGGMTGLIVAACAASQKQKQVTKQLAQFEDVRSVGPLAEALEYQDRDIHATAAEALIRLLPRLQASDAYLLNEEQRACLYRVLRGRNSAKYALTELTVAILKALEQVGDAEAIPYVQKLADGEGLAARERRVGQLQWRVRDAAEACLPALRQRVERERSRQTLLRASSASDTPSDVLLRPASGTIEADPQQLLRASATEERAERGRDRESAYEPAAV